MSMGMWSRLLDWVEETWCRHVSQRELFRQLDRVRDDLRARTAWVDELTEEDYAEMLRNLTVCLEALQEAGSDAPERPESTS
ncbi:hypothetical protein [Streptomyces chattanoogensis]|uniref:hypothetical protein n=1 Tax=Streptomyces chattanoogensis TaxID=66876 RepID=UPI003676CAF7